jgi:hypothetical protein
MTPPMMKFSFIFELLSAGIGLNMDGVVVISILLEFGYDNPLFFSLFNLVDVVHCRFFDHKAYGDWKLQGTCRENLHYLRKRTVRIAGFPRNSYSLIG